LAIPALQGPFEPWMNEGDIHELVVRGKIPADLRGTFFRNGSWKPREGWTYSLPQHGERLRS